MIGIRGTSGTLNPRSNFGCVLRRMITDTPTIANVNNAPIFAKFDNSFKSINPAIKALPIPVNQVENVGASVFFVNFRKRFWQ